ncbi:hypothetical protein EXN66_Car012317 [Channa argus]|uniref:Uncharacterized protein n=1 Tax=Channa argus TaxID=215402 RepID=A0A6G1Q2F0_CHAAH|nr:hypothetical protein EXN66_Car012317 [Channa argus]
MLMQRFQSEGKYKEVKGSSQEQSQQPTVTKIIYIRQHGLIMQWNIMIYSVKYVH